MMVIYSKARLCLFNLLQPFFVTSEMLLNEFPSLKKKLKQYFKT